MDFKFFPPTFQILEKLISTPLVPPTREVYLIPQWMSSTPQPLVRSSSSLQKGKYHSFGLIYILLFYNFRTNSSNGSLSNSPLNLLSSRCPLPTVPFSLPECQLLCDQSPSNQPTHQHQEVNLSAGRRIPKSKKEARSLSPSPYRRDSKGNRCPECSAKFARARDLKRHFRLHTGEKPYPCKSCGESFIRSDARGRHWIANPDCFTAHNGGEI